MMAKRFVLGILICLGALPFLYLAMLSLAGEWRFPDLMPQTWTLGHWISAGASGAHWINAAGCSFLLASLSAAAATVSGFLTAKYLSEHPRRDLWLSLAYLPYAFSPVIYAHCLKFYFNVAGMSGSFTGVLLAHFFLSYPFSMLLFFRHFDPALKAMEDLTYTLGGNRKVMFWKVLIPVSRKALWLCFFQTFLISWFEYGLISVIGQGQVRTLSIGVYQYIGEANQYVAALASCLLCLPPLFLLWLNQRFVFRQSTL